MALQKPYNINLRGQTIDANDINIVSWQVTGDLSYAYQVKIVRNSDYVLQYDSGKITSFAISHTIPSMSIANGIEYRINITIWNQSGSDIVSDSEIFQTSSRPVVIIPSTPLITSPAYNFSANYSQAESISARSWIVYLFNSNHIKIAESPISTNPSIQYIFSELQSNTEYYVEFQVTSSKGLTGTSGQVQFAVSYSQPDMNINLTAENTDDAGIRISWKTIQIIGKTTQSPTYIDNEYIDLTDNTFYLDDEAGFSLEDDFTIKIWMRDIDYETDLVILTSIYGSIYLQYWSEDNRFHLFKDISGYKSHYVSTPVTGTDFFVCIQQISYDMNIFAEVV